MKFTAKTIADFLVGTIEGDPSIEVSEVCKIEEGRKGGLSFLSNPKYEDYLYTTDSSIVIVNNDFVARKPVSTTLIRVPNAYESFASLLDLYAQSKPRKTGLRERSSVAADAVLGSNVYVGEFAVIDSGASVGDNTAIYPGAYVGDRVRIGRDCKIFAGVKIYEDCVIGDRVTLHAGAVIGADGFGFAPMEDGSYQKIAQIGNVVLEDDVEIGANTCVDRATMGSTIIHHGVKLDNLIQVGHNVTIGENTVMAAQVGVAGSTKVGSNVMMGGQVGIAGHLTIANGVKLGSQSGVDNSIEKEGETGLGSPFMTGFAHHRSHAIYKDLPALRTKIFAMIKDIEELKKK
ncbi:MAG: UDP-3-O-(3-hydroxymyristoyl)glucosamine N-acyltransferase [Mucinivorans sp.]